MVATLQKIGRVKTFDHLLYLEKCYGTRFQEEHWMVALRSFRRIARQAKRSDVLRSGDILAGRISRRLPTSSIVLAGETALTFGNLGLHSTELASQCRKVNVKNAKVVDLTKCLWGSVLLNDLCREHFIKLARSVEEVAACNFEIGIHDCRRLHMCSLVGRIRWGDEVLGKSTKKHIHLALEKLKSQQTNPSKFQNEVTAFIRKRVSEKWRMETEYFLEGFHIDIAFPDQKIAVEVDGPYHFYPGTEEIMTKDLVKDEILTGLGWCVMHISYRDWQNK